MTTALYQRMVAFNYGDDERAALMRKVWAGHQWMVDAFTGRCGDVREHEMLHWCYDTFGEQASPIHGRAGEWLRGSATVNGWTWFGFANKPDMEKFLARWPAPTSDEAAI